MFSNLIVSVLAFVLALGVLVAIHEWGHFWVARRVGVKILRYSIGFGRPLWSRRGRVDNTEYVVAAIPLGGYVKMLDEREGTVDAAEAHRSFNRQPLWARTAIVIAGPLANLILAVFAYWLVMMVGIEGIAPRLAAVPADTPAASAGLRELDTVESVGGTATASWTEVNLALIEAAAEGERIVPVAVQRADGERETVQLSLDGHTLFDADPGAMDAFGLAPWFPVLSNRIGKVMPGGVAESAGLKAGETIVAIDDVPVMNFTDLVNAVSPAANQALTFSVVGLDGAERRVNLTPAPVEQNGVLIGRIGLGPVAPDPETLASSRVTVHYAPWPALLKALEKTHDMSVLTLRMIGKLVTGQASLQNISGPISIARVAGQSAQVSTSHYIDFIALISLSLAVLNLLPIPLLDGGHLAYFAYEAVRGKPLSEQAQWRAQQVGMLVLGTMMVLAFWFDLWRLVQ